MLVDWKPALNFLKRRTKQQRSMHVLDDDDMVCFFYSFSVLHFIILHLNECPILINGLLFTDLTSVLTERQMFHRPMNPSLDVFLKAKRGHSKITFAQICRFLTPLFVLDTTPPVRTLNAKLFQMFQLQNY